MIRTIWMKVAYIVILIISAIFAVLYLGSFSVLLLGVLIILPVLLQISLWYIRFNLDVNIETGTALCHRKKNQTIKLIVKNKGFLPVGKAGALVVFSGASTKDKIPVSVSFPIPAKNTATIQITVSAQHCGLNEIEIKHLQITDYIRLFSHKLHNPSRASVMVLPYASDINYSLDIPCSPSDEESSIYSKLRPGDDPSEVYRIREYRPGDVPKRIHWKLSSRTDTTWVKEYSLPISRKAAVLIDYSYSSSFSADLMDISLDAAYSLSLALVKQEVPTTIYWVSGQSNKIMWNEVHSPSDINSCFTAILSHDPSSEPEELLKQGSEIMAIHSTNALYYCTYRYDLKEIESYFRTFKENHIHVLTSDCTSSHESPFRNVIFIRDGSIADDLKKLSDLEVKYE